MAELEQLKAAYGFDKAEWIVKGEKLSTEKGIKVLRRWENNQLMNWHIQWREAVDNRGVCLTNRMIRTMDGDMAFLDLQGWLTLHDEVTSLFSYEGREHELAELTWAAITVGLKMDGADLKRPFLSEQEIVDAVRKLPARTDPVVMSIMKKTLSEAVSRLEKADRLTRLEESRLPVIDPFTGMAQGREIYGQLFWTFSGRFPEKGLRSAASFMKECCSSFGKERFTTFLESLDNSGVFDEDIYLEILREALVPWEFLGTVEQIGKAGPEDPEKAYLLLEAMYREWEQSRAFVLVLSEWLDGKREKVAN
ncbi:hypothetical protein CR205_01590 [Alteribacter lacisalsi]|uniref:Uncharacterized protein n=1 Tax=Alteribacter lacisalsi TaxID=2045244 RepID=A0A2W0HJT6_9BACI|nr:hypothetical protein [Alteribacter lacisalsi]PYZ97322.1 hypothetical protein CR205_01590 [Alteribacter lacisalsi]